VKVDSKTGLVQASPQVQSKPRRLSEDTAMSYDEWALCGYFIRKGEKSDILGIPQFTIEQVEKKKQRRSHRYY
jgi:hypothetical protein